MTTKSSDNTEAIEKLTLNCSEVEEQASSSTKDKGKAEVAEEAVDDVNEKKLITLKTSDGIEFEVEECVMLQSETIKHIIEDGCSENVIPLHNCNRKYLGLIIEYCKKHYGKMDRDEEELKKWDAEFIDIDNPTLFDLITAADYLSVKGLLEILVEKVLSMIRDKTPEEMRISFGIQNDFTPEEEEEYRATHRWAFDDLE
ncbi:Skp1-like protein [Thalictrum thalictroides]|uniref:SKP1-like protein n=1 Tax=Thalictrum thalictroides TaxID=46969 RepID=A0A7J6X0F2_THATH|nr:Skp1-like protein [Thalictrum thalictroides]